MEEVDQIILHNLRQLECAIDATVSSIQLLSTEQIVEAVVKCLLKIYGHIEVPAKLPQGMSSRFRHASEIAKLVQDLGFKGELGYQSFLYASEADLRRILMFLVEKLPRETVDVESDTHCSYAVFKQNLAIRLSLQLRSPWLPYYCSHMTPVRRAAPSGFVDLLQNCPGVKSIIKTTLDVIPGFLDWNSASIIGQRPEDRLDVQATPGGVQMSSENFPDQSKFGQPRPSAAVASKLTRSFLTDDVFKPAHVSVDEDEAEVSTEERLKQLRGQLNEMITSISAKLELLQNSKDEVTRGQVASELLIAENKQKGMAFKLSKRTLDLLTNPEENLARMEELLRNSRLRLDGLVAQWDTHGRLLGTQLTKLQDKRSTVLAYSENKVAEIKKMRGTMKSMVEESNTKNEVVRQLKVDYDKMAKDVNRGAYTRRIMDIISNINNQKTEIHKILGEVVSIQKDINFLMGKVDRCFQVTDERLFKDAVRDDTAKKSYKHLASLHDFCNCLMHAIEDTDQLMKDVRDLKDQADFESQKKTGSKLASILEDFEAMRTENVVLARRIKQLRGDEDGEQGSG